MHAKVSGRGGRFFAHNRRTTDCTGAGETEEHRSLSAFCPAEVVWFEVQASRPFRVT